LLRFAEGDGLRISAFAKESVAFFASLLACRHAFIAFGLRPAELHTEGSKARSKNACEASRDANLGVYFGVAEILNKKQQAEMLI
jgi:hypothetical protein